MSAEANWCAEYYLPVRPQQEGLQCNGSPGSIEPVKPGFCNESTEKPLRRVRISIGVATSAHMQLTVISRRAKPLQAWPCPLP